VKWCGVKWCGVKWCDVMWCEVKWSDVKWSEVMWSDVEWSDVKWCGVMWRDLYEVILFVSEMKWSDVSYGEVLEGQNYHAHYGDHIQRILDCIVTISVSGYLVLWLFLTFFVMCGGVVGPRWGRDFPQPSRLFLGLTQPSIQRYQGLSRGG